MAEKNASLTLFPIAHIETDFKSKFGIPRQSGLVEELTSRIVFCPEYRDINALRGLEGYSHIWVIWHFSAIPQGKAWQPTVKPPRLGGNRRVGVFATRSPFRPNPLGLSCLKLEKIDLHKKDGPCLLVTGADLMDGTPIFDIKPYLPLSDCKEEAFGGFTSRNAYPLLEVEIPCQLKEKIPAHLYQGLIKVLAEDPRPSYQQDPDRLYGFCFADLEIRFRVKDILLTVVEIEKVK